jgi:DNA-binding GntR family transcriptional regulator
LTDTRNFSSLTKTEAAFRALRASIEEGHRRPGDPLRIADLVEEFGISPTPIREALRMLQMEGMVEHAPHHGMTVAVYPVERVEEVYTLRLAIEPMATRLAAERMTDERMLAIRARHQDLVDSVEADGAHSATLNARWHQAIYAAADSGLISDFVSRLWGSVPVEAVWVSVRATESLKEHAAIMEAVEQQQGERAAELMRQHISAGEEELTARIAALDTPAT